MTNKPFSMYCRANMHSYRFEYMENGTNVLEGALSDRKGKERKIDMEAKQRLEQIKNDIKKVKGVLSEERECMEKVNQEIYDAEAKRRELEEQIETAEVWLEELTRDQWELEKEIEEAKKPKTIWDLENCDEHYWVLGTGEVMRDFWFGSKFQNEMRDIGNVFLTEQEAEDEARVRKLIAKAKRSEGRKNFVSNEINWEITCIYPSDISQSKVTVGYYISVSRANVFGSWETQEAAEKVLHENYEEFKWYFTEYLQ